MTPNKPLERIDFDDTDFFNAVEDQSRKICHDGRDQDILISKNGKVVAKLVTAKVDKVAAAEELISMFPKGKEVDYDKMREERLLR